MSASFVQTVWTLIAFVFFIAIVIWAWSGKRKKEFDEAARMPLEDDDTGLTSGQKLGRSKADV
jgi:cytochrome c oxidase cbb3-type subunit 4